MEQQRISTRTLILIVAAVVLTAAIVGTLIWLFRPAGTQVYVTVNGVEYGSYDLRSDRTVVIQPEDGSWHNTLVIRGGTANVTESDCSNQICVMTPPLTEDTVGIIVCLPHGVAVELK